MSSYKLIAFDMDGTLLNSEKKISRRNLDMIQKAIAAGKEVILNTGRCPAELDEYIEMIPGLRYLNCISGALVYDLKDKKHIYSKFISPDVVKAVIEATKQEDIMYHMMTEQSYVQKKDWEQMEYYQMGVYKDMFLRVTHMCDDILEFYEKDPFPLAKMNLYHPSTEVRVRTKQSILDHNIPVSMAFSEIASLEISAQKVDKGIGLKKLCEYLGISIDETIAVGDGYNDLEALKAAGLSIAMGNAVEEIKEIADVVVADCDHDGCAQAIEQYLI